MPKHADKSQENKSQAVANNLPQLQSNVESSLQFADKKPVDLAQQNLQEGINNSPRVQQLKAYQEMANNSLPVKQLRAYQMMANNFTSQTAQRKDNLEEEPLQGKFESIQKKEKNIGLVYNLETKLPPPSGGNFNITNTEEDISTNSKTLQANGLIIIQRVKKIPRPTFTKEVLTAIKLKQGQHRRHIVMSSRMREAIWAYHMSEGILPAAKISRRKELQTVVGMGTLRSEMATLTALAHNSMGNLFPGKGSENTAIGFAVNPLYNIAQRIDDKTLNTYDKIFKAVEEWDNMNTFGFALVYKKFLGELIKNWLKDKENHDNDIENIASAIQDFAFSCSFDFAYIEEGDGERKNHVFPDHVDKDIQEKLLRVATTLEEVIQNPKNDHQLYPALTYLLQISKNKPSQ